MNPRDNREGIARKIAKAKSWKKVQAMRRQAEYWRNLWRTKPEAMRSNLERINTARKEKANQRTEAIRAICSTLPSRIASLDLRDSLRNALAIAGHPSEPRDAEKLLSNLRRRRLIAFDLATLTWKIDLD